MVLGELQVIYIKREKILPPAGTKVLSGIWHKKTLDFPKRIPAPLANLLYLSHSRSLFSCLSVSRPSSNSLYHGLFCIHSFTSLQPCSAITPAILRSSSGGRTFKHLAYLSSSEKVFFTVGCLLCISVQQMVIIFNLAVISVFDCFI